MTPLEKITKARSQLIIGFPFYGALSLRLKLVEDASVQTAMVNSVTIRYNPAFIDSLTLPETIGLVAHEVSHVALGHPWRMTGHDQRLGNMAADYAINPLLVDAGLTLPKGSLIDPAYNGKSYEEIYAILKRAQKPQDKPGASNAPRHDKNDPSQPAPSAGAPSSDPGRCGGVEPAPTPNPSNPQSSPAQQSASRLDWEIAVEQAAQFAKGTGQISADLARAVTEIKKPKIDWRETLRRFVAASAPSDYSWQRPNRRFMPNLYLPSLREPRLGTIAVFEDSSGSMTQRIKDQVAAELNALFEEAQPESVYLVSCDCAIKGIAELTPDDWPVKLNFKGGGGTDFRPPFAHLEQNGIVPACAIYLTDLKCNSFPVEPEYPVLWVSTGRTVAPFGDVLKLPAEG